LKTIAIIPARTDSSRLPGKHFLDMGGYCVLDILTDRVRSVREIDEVVIATTDRKCDLPLADYAARKGLKVYCGQLDDVLGRFIGAAQAFDADMLVRVNGDCILISPEVIKNGLNDIINKNLEFVTGKNAYSGLPVGLGAEIIRTDALERVGRLAYGQYFRENVTTFIFENPSVFLWAPVSIKKEWAASDIKLVLDTQEDYNKLRALISRMILKYGPEFENWSIERIIKSCRDAGIY
jgi:spore coat polysaccharide biosynthesis protein SpsF